MTFLLPFGTFCYLKVVLNTITPNPIFFIMVITVDVACILKFNLI
jgi:hypothetical protein